VNFSIFKECYVTRTRAPGRKIHFVDLVYLCHIIVFFYICQRWQSYNPNNETSERELSLHSFLCVYIQEIKTEIMTPYPHSFTLSHHGIEDFRSIISTESYPLWEPSFSQYSCHLLLNTSSVKFRLVYFYVETFLLLTNNFAVSV